MTNIKYWELLRAMRLSPSFGPETLPFKKLEKIYLVIWTVMAIFFF